MEPKRSRACPATMRDVAQQAGVSTATVSRALMHPEKVSPATLQRVRRAAFNIGYAPLYSGLLIKSQDSATLLALAPDSGRPAS
ncbi:LacI family transcriptional regulator [Sodalis-like symbiont of Bactericera trigonica]|nr:LacI family transcriptional regulator [Sodalis-like symbiont of Bactericera trigonica]